MQFAHRNLIVHRDLKPSNILVTVEGQPKLLDFGIAKLLSSDDAATTAADLKLYTPEYASPEQVEGGLITTATDVYSLGVVLFEILIGRRPESGPGLIDPESLKAACRLVLEESTSVARVRGVEPRQLLRQVGRDLDRIVSKARKQVPEERYSSAEELSRDLQAYMSGLPISARKPSAAYRLSKFLKRNKTILSFLSAALFMAVVFVFSLIQERRETERQLRASQEVSQFLLDIFEAPDPGLSRGSETTAKEILERAIERIDSSLGSQPEVKARLLTLAGRTYLKLGLHLEATPLLQEAVKIREGLSDSALELAESLDGLARAYQEAAEYHRARQLFERSLTLRRGRLAPNDPEIAFSLNELAALAFDEGDFEDASALFAEAVELDMSNHGINHPDTATSFHNLGSALLHLGRLDDAESRLRTALRIRRELLGESHYQVADSLQQLGLLSKTRGDLDDSETFNRQALDIRLEVLGRVHTDTSMTMNNLAVLLRQMGRPEEAVGFAENVVEIRRELYGERHPAYALALANLATIYTSLQRDAEAQGASEEAVEVYRNLDESPPGSLGHSLVTLASVLIRQGEYEAASRHLDEALVELDSLERPNLQILASIARSLKGLTLASLGHDEKAEHMLLLAYEALRTQLGPDSRPTNEALERIVSFYAQQSKDELAEQYRAQLAPTWASPHGF